MATIPQCPHNLRRINFAAGDIVYSLVYCLECGGIDTSVSEIRSLNEIEKRYLYG